MRHIYSLRFPCIYLFKARRTKCPTLDSSFSQIFHISLATVNTAVGHRNCKTSLKPKTSFHFCSVQSVLGLRSHDPVCVYFWWTFRSTGHSRHCRQVSSHYCCFELQTLRVKLRSVPCGSLVYKSIIYKNIGVAAIELASDIHHACSLSWRLPDQFSSVQWGQSYTQIHNRRWAASATALGLCCSSRLPRHMLL